MDTAVALVQSYLNINGYFTVVEYPILEQRGDSARTATDLDVLAFRFPGAGRETIRVARRRAVGPLLHAPDPALGCPADRPDMIVGEIKEGRPRFNPAARDAGVLGAALTRFGCCTHGDLSRVVEALLRRGVATTPCGHAVRMVAFGSGPGTGRTRCHVVPIAHVIRFLRRYLREHWTQLRHVPFRESSLGLLALIEKAGD